ncbi:MAG: C25 family cysteine peptidase [Candidatus Promineifilaceae bacterium]|nr:C25 family cysteine peptidase [Candidatus Promineifilaceae bacterium]
MSGVGRTRVLVACLLLAVALLGGFWLTAASAEGVWQPTDPVPMDEAGPVHVVDLQERVNGLSVTLASQPLIVDDDGWLTELPTNIWLREPGEPQLPYFATYIALPPGADAQASITTRARTLIQDVNVRPAPDPSSSPARSSGIGRSLPARAGLAETQRTNGEVYLRQAFYPTKLFSLSEPMQMADQRLARLTVFPYRYDPVSAELMIITRLTIDIEFTAFESGGSQVQDGRQSLNSADLPANVLNQHQALSWRAMPTLNTQSSGVTLPADRASYQLEVSENGLYQVSYEDLDAVGFPVDAIDPHALQLMHGGQAVAHQLIADEDGEFEPGEAVRFFGWAFDGTRAERPFVASNTFWLWANGAPIMVDQATSASTGVSADYFTSTVTTAPDRLWWPTFIDEWDHFPNEPDAWYWQVLTKTTTAPATTTLPITLPFPATSGPRPQILAEFTSGSAGNGVSHSVQLSLNDGPVVASASWDGKANVNAVGLATADALQNGANTVAIALTTPAAVLRSQSVYLNRITVDYPRRFQAVSDMLVFDYASGNPVRFSVGNFTSIAAGGPLVWDITDRYQPAVVSVSDISVSGVGPYTYTFGSTLSGEARYLVASPQALKKPTAIKAYEPGTLEPLGGGAEWLAIAYDDFVDAAQQLAGHRNDPRFGGMTTHVVAVSDVIAQYGFGMATPEAIRNYLRHAFGSWNPAPKYVLLLGDASVDPLGLADGSQPFTQVAQFVPTSLPFADRYWGQIPSDYPYSLLVGDDLLPDIAIGRLPAATSDDAFNMVEKIITYETNQRAPDSLMMNALYVADQDPYSDEFCRANHEVAEFLPPRLQADYLCLSWPADAADVELLRDLFFSQINDPRSQTGMVNYRGHGNVFLWAGSPRNILDNTDVDLFENYERPVAIFSADCLDGHFAHPVYPGMSETMLRAPGGKAAVAYWASAGEGYTFEHNVLQDAFFQSLFSNGGQPVGDAANASKATYLLAGGHESNAFSFALLGDPAMLVYRNAAPVAAPDIYQFNGPSITVAAPGVLVNDHDPDPEDGILQVVVKNEPSSGSLKLQLDGSFVYTPTVSFNGTDSFSYQAFDEHGNVGTGQVTLLSARRIYLPYLNLSHDN